jgi:hypothetical protein
LNDFKKLSFFNKTTLFLCPLPWQIPRIYFNMVQNSSERHERWCCADSFQLLTPKIPCVFLPNFAVFDIVGKNQFLKK